MSDWYYSGNGKDRQGPVSAGELGTLAQRGEIGPDWLVWKEGMADWMPARKIKGLSFPDGAGAKPPGNGRFDARRVQDIARRAGQHYDETAAKVGFLDLKFTRFVSLPVIRFLWAGWLVLVALALVGSAVGGLLRFPIHEAVIGFVGAVLLLAFLTLLFRVALEGMAVVFQMADDLREISRRGEPASVETGELV